MDYLGSKDHWEKVYSTKATDAVSWFQPHADLSVGLIKAAGVGRDASIIDVGGGASALVDDLLADAEFGEAISLLNHQKEAHHTPFGTVQQFVYCYSRRVGS